MTVGDWLRSATRRLTDAGIESARLDAELLAAFALQISRDVLLAHPELFVPEGIGALLERRASGEPIAYIVGFREFFGRPFHVDARVLIPRTETETVVEVALDKVSSGSVVLDVGTGSGNIAITLALERPDLTVIGSDISFDSLQVAAHNAMQLHARISLVRMDMLSAVRKGSLDAIVSNPPYVDPKDERIETGVRKFEPSRALFSTDGIGEIARLILRAKSALRQNGVLIFEFGSGQAAEVIDMLSGWEDIAIFKDLAGLDRVAFASRPQT